MATLSTARFNIRTGRTLPSDVSSLRATKDSLSFQLSRLEEEIKAKNTEIREITMSIQHCDILLSPVRRLPDEMLLRVFSFAVDTTISQVACQIIVGHVCRRWRTLSRSFPSLWSTIHISVTFPNGKQWSKPSCKPQLIEQCLVLSQPLPLDIVATFTNVTVSEHRAKIAKYVDGVLALLISHATRWRSFGYSGPFIRAGYPNIDDRLSSLRLKMLESLNITFRDESYHELEEDPVHVPNLRILHTSTLIHGFVPQWNLLTKFTGPFEDTTSCYEFLAKATNLTSLHLTHIGPYGNAERPPLILKNLRTFLVNSCALVPLLNTFVTPLLEEFTETTYDQNMLYDTVKHPNECTEPGSDATTILRSLVGRSRCPVRSLNTGGAMLPSMILPIFKECGDTLTQLTINLYTNACYSDSDETLELLTLPNLFTCLVELEIKTDMTEDWLIRGHRMEEMLRSRWDVPGGGSLKRLRLELEEFPDDSPSYCYNTSTLAHYLHSQRDKGLDVQWHIGGCDMLAQGRKAFEAFM